MHERDRSTVTVATPVGAAMISSGEITGRIMTSGAGLTAPPRSRPLQARSAGRAAQLRRRSDLTWAQLGYQRHPAGLGAVPFRSYSIDIGASGRTSALIASYGLGEGFGTSRYAALGLGRDGAAARRRRRWNP